MKPIWIIETLQALAVVTFFALITVAIAARVWKWIKCRGISMPRAIRTAVATILVAALMFGLGALGGEWRFQRMMDEHDNAYDDAFNVRQDNKAAIVAGVSRAFFQTAYAQSLPLGKVDLGGKHFTVDLSKAAGSYALCTVTGGPIQVLSASFEPSGSIATFTSVAIFGSPTLAGTASATFLSSTQGARANLTANVNTTGNAVAGVGSRGPWSIQSGEIIQYTMVGSTGTGSMDFGIGFISLTEGATCQ